jgi:hypothetical protein
MIIQWFLNPHTKKHAHYTLKFILYFYHSKFVNKHLISLLSIFPTMKPHFRTLSKVVPLVLESVL